MKNLIWLVLVMLFTSSCNKEEKEINALKENGIFELKYLKEYAHDYSPDSLNINTCDFNYLYNSLSLVNASDSTILFISYQSERYFLLNIYEDSIRIYKREQYAEDIETTTWNNLQVLYFDISRKIEKNSFDSLEMAMSRAYSLMHESKIWYNNGKLEYRGVWKSKDNDFFIHYKYDCCWARIAQFKYEKTIKNDFLPLDKYKIVTPK